MSLKRNIIAIVLLWSFITPMTIQAIHAYDGHEHTVCMDFSTHVHQTTFDCQVDQFQFSSFNFIPNDPIVKWVHQDSKLQPALYKSRESKSFLYLNPLRGPPGS